MSRVYRPLPCAGAIGAPCSSCLRLEDAIAADAVRIRPEPYGGRCSDYIAGRRPATPVRVTPAIEPAPLELPPDGSEDLPWWGFDLAGEET